MKKATLRDVATRVGLHPVTVSRMLAGTYAGSAETTERVRQTAQNLGYRISIFAKAMRGRSMPFVLFSGNLDPYSLGYIRVLENRLQEHGLTLQIVLNPERLPQLIESLHPLATVLLWTQLSPSLRTLYTRSDVISLHAEIPPGIKARCFRLHMDFGVGFAELARHLHSLRHRRCVFLTCDDLDLHPIYRERRERFTETLCRLDPSASVRQLSLARLTDLPEMITAVFTPANRPTALVCLGDMMAYQAIFQLCQLGVRVPQEVSVTGCDGIPILTQCPRVTTVNVDHAAVAEQLVQWITSEIAPAKKRKEQVQAVSCRLPCYLHEDASTAPAMP